MSGNTTAAEALANLKGAISAIKSLPKEESDDLIIAVADTLRLLHEFTIGLVWFVEHGEYADADLVSRLAAKHSPALLTDMELWYSGLLDDIDRKGVEH